MLRLCTFHVVGKALDYARDHAGVTSGATGKPAQAGWA